MVQTFKLGHMNLPNSLKFCLVGEELGRDLMFLTTDLIYNGLLEPFKIDLGFNLLMDSTTKKICLLPSVLDVCPVLLYCSEKEDLLILS